MRVMLFILFFLLSYSVKGQDQLVIDSLKTVIQKAGHDTGVSHAYLGWGEQLYLVNPDTAVTLWQKTRGITQRNLANDLEPSLKKVFSVYLADAVNNIAFISEQQGEINKAIEYYHKSLMIHKQQDNKTGIANLLNNIAAVYYNQGDIGRALEFFHKSLYIREEIGNEIGIAESINNIGLIYDDQDDKTKAMEYYQRSLKMYEEISKSPDDRLAKAGKNGQATTLNNIGFMSNSLEKTEAALQYYQKSLKIYKEIGSTRGMATAFGNMGLVYEHKKNDISEALVHYNKSLQLLEELNSRNGISNTLSNIGNAEFKLGELTEALNYGTRGLEIAQELGSPNLIAGNSALLSRVAKARGNYEEALEFFELHIQMRDSIKNDETQKSTIRQQTKYEFEKAQLIDEQKAKDEARLEKEATSRRDNLQYSIILIAILALFGGILALGFINVSERTAEGIIFFSFLILFEFFLVLADPYIEGWSGGAPGFKLLFNAGIAALIFPAHAFFEARLKGRLVKGNA